MFKIKQSQLKTIVFWRKIISPINFWWLKNTKYRNVKIPDIFRTIKDYSPQKFSEYINKYPYKPDSNNGKFDNTIQFPDFFFVKRDSDRDCDDFVRMWFWYLQKYHLCKEVYEVYVIDNEDLSSAHMTCFAKMFDGTFRVFDYKYSQHNYKSFQECADYIHDKYNHKGTTLFEVYNKA